ncbi:uncharacterized protein sS8_2309 [Methylocaldum marinum]|uniref:Polysaccharide pyruvyl transferase domain-containing protein n=1 Tax=Methylocaldum marinum TaxID=1432792 RepID=A0A250KTH7_9GAMM|nr:polysaccharide pyruvyl transferase family protein [Methylocaldum marinum]BBA34261.1 uncharacterized protein sS8_2309 [Methylocaldum marinum]
MNVKLSFKSVRSRMRESVRIPLLYDEWRKERKRLAQIPPAPQTRQDVRSIIIAPADVISLTGSKGDEAMIAALVEGVRRHIPDCRFGIFSYGGEASHANIEPGVTPEPVWANPWSFRRVLDTVARYDAVAIVGGDVLDGYYTPITSLRLWMLGDLATRMGKPAVVLGFSFNASPSPKLGKCLNALDPALNVCVRDAVSLERFNRFSNIPGRLVADSAFLLHPRTDGSEVTRIRAWAEQQRARGRTVCGFNLHPMLIKSGDPVQLQALVDSAVATLSGLHDRRPVSFLLIPHDFRGGTLGDDAVLGPIYERIRADFGEHAIYPSAPLHAAELKALAGCTDFVVTGRMHLAIASLGQGVPVAVITYQDKFQGLFQHFGLPESLMMPPDRIRDPAEFTKTVSAALDAKQGLAEQVALKLPEVLRLAELNLSPLLGNVHDG